MLNRRAVWRDCGYHVCLTALWFAFQCGVSLYAHVLCVGFFLVFRLSLAFFFCKGSRAIDDSSSCVLFANVSFHQITLLEWTYGKESLHELICSFFGLVDLQLPRKELTFLGKRKWLSVELLQKYFFPWIWSVLEKRMGTGRYPWKLLSM